MLEFLDKEFEVKRLIAFIEKKQKLIGVIFAFLAVAFPGIFYFYKLNVEIGYALYYHIPFSLLQPYQEENFNIIFLAILFLLFVALIVISIYTNIVKIEKFRFAIINYILLILFISSLISICTSLLLTIPTSFNLPLILEVSWIFFPTFSFILSLLFSPILYWKWKKLTKKRTTITPKKQVIIRQHVSSQKIKKELTTHKICVKNHTLHAKRKKKIWYIILSYLLWIAVIISFVAFIHQGLNYATSTRNFSIIKIENSNSQTSYAAVIYEKSSQYLITPCTIEGNTISFTDLNQQNIIGKEGTEYTIQRLTPQINN